MIGPQGIFKPRDLQSPLSITTSPESPLGPIRFENVHREGLTLHSWRSRGSGMAEERWDIAELEKLVEENRKAFERAKQLLERMKEKDRLDLERLNQKKRSRDDPE